MPLDEVDDSGSIEFLKHLTHQIICHRNVSRLLSQSDWSIDQVSNNLAHLIPEGFRYPDVASVRIIVGTKEYMTANFQESPISISKEIFVNDTPQGEIEVHYPPGSVPEESAFRDDERDLLSTIALEFGQYLARKQAEQKIVQQYHELRIYSSLLTHDLRNDVGVILANVDLLRMLLGDATPQVKQVISSLEALCERMTSLLKAFSRSSKIEESSIVKILEQTITWAKDASPNITFNLEYDPIVADAKIPATRMLSMVFDNLFRNAAKYAGDHPTIDINVTLKDNFVEIVVADNGPGIPEEIQEKLFQKGASTSGSGFGLYLSREIMKTIDGSIELADAEEHTGATFLIRIPVSY